MQCCRVSQLTFHKSLMETLIEDSSPSTSHLTVIVEAFEPLFHRTTAKRWPESGPAQI